ncbi:MAG: hypothetical protein SF187_04470 [Deltaproteobacteria bacterium]|nr:hypothetical protein [Deltaproteobacteria bacterium]
MFESQDEAIDEAFDEYDEDMEASDETFEASDESDEAFDESDESDEAFEASDESDEAFDESDESDEATPSATVRIRAFQDKARRAQFQSGIAKVAALEAKRAAATRQTITNQLRAINLGGRSTAHAAAPVQGGMVTATLANGRKARISFTPRLAPLSEVNKLRNTFNHNDRQQTAALATQRKALAGLAAAQAAAVTKLTAQQVKSDKELGARIAAGHTKLDKRISAESAANKVALEKHGRRTLRLIKRQRQRQLLNNVLMATALPLYSAYGRRELLSKNNMILTGALGGFLLGDEMIDQFTGKGKGGKTWSGVANLWSWAAPVAYPLAAHYLLKDTQNERFVTGFKDITLAGGVGADEVTLDIAEDAVADFAKLKSVPAVATLVGAEGNVSASVVDGKLKLSVTDGAAAVTKVTVAYVVDAHAEA